ncbi:MAG: phosphoglycerate kinase [Dehalococcoidia bacterium]|nr:phosphoglycerate kinase [Dehalococcoidia bacterium]MDD5494760.1 phosphoglycerate kinase [Dehalococcoidia bacterium]
MKKSIRDVEVTGKRVLVRVDFNVPLDPRTNEIMDDSRIIAALPTIWYLIQHEAKIILCSHLGRPDGKVVESLRLTPIAERLSQLTNLPIYTVSDCIGAKVKKAVSKLKNGDILLLENLRFHPEEEANDPNFAKALADLADIYVDDAFGTAHRAHASTYGVAKFLPAYAGILLEKEIKALGNLLNNAQHPFAVLLGGAKVSDKIKLINNMMDKVEMLLVGGGMAATFLKAQNYGVGISSVEEDKMDLANKLVETAKQHNIKLLLPLDVIVADAINDQARPSIAPVTMVPPNKYIVDIGPQTIELFTESLKQCRTIFWNGPMGVYEIPQFSRGTKAMAELLANLSATTVVGGGSTAEIVIDMHLGFKMTHVSTGGGASLSFLEGKSLPGVDVLLDE